MPIPGNLLTTAMAVMPHRDVDRALEVALSLDIPFWPQLPHVNYYEDMYVQASEHFPGTVVDMEHQTLSFSMDKFLPSSKRPCPILTSLAISTYRPSTRSCTTSFWKWTWLSARPSGGSLKDPSASGSTSRTRTTALFSLTTRCGPFCWR